MARNLWLEMNVANSQQGWNSKKKKKKKAMGGKNENDTNHPNKETA